MRRLTRKKNEAKKKLRILSYTDHEYPSGNPFSLSFFLLNN